MKGWSHSGWVGFRRCIDEKVEERAKEGIIHLPGSQQSGWWVVPGRRACQPPLSSPPPQFFFICCLLLLRKPLYFILSCSLLLGCCVCAHGVGQGSIQHPGRNRRGEGWLAVCVGHGGARWWQIRADRARPAMWVFLACLVPRKEEGGPGSRGSGRLAGGSGCCSSSMLGDRTELMLCDGHGGCGRWWAASGWAQPRRMVPT